MKKIGPYVIMSNEEYKYFKKKFESLKYFSEQLIREIAVNEILISRYEKMLNINKNKKEEN